MSKILICSLVWCPEGDVYRSKAQDALDHVNLVLKELDGHTSFTYRIINNNVQNTYLLGELSKLDLNYIDVVPEKDWAGARNTALQYFMSEDFTHVLFLDCDAFMNEGWRDRVLEYSLNNDLHAICEDPHPSVNPLTLPNNTIVYKKREFMGLFNLLSRKCIETLGGFDCYNFHRYGYQDIDYGRRLLHSGLLDYTGGSFVSLYQEALCYNKPATLTPEENKSRNDSINRNTIALIQKTTRIELKQDLYFDYNYTGPDVDRI